MGIRITVLATTLLVCAACAGVQPGERPDGTVPGGIVLTQEDVQRVHARSAMDAVLRSQNFLDIRQTSDGRVSRITSRGASSLYIDVQVAVVVDGAHVLDALEALRAIPAGNIARIEILTARQAAPVYGTSAGSGAIIVTTAADIGG
ncbi:MAG TPA: TonB-dependent receptor plug domain-containing protein [Longimicrobiales bacterium]|nr:TonB-dependent receptor plug domain-containing protein [Longimicrobiales bacterium]